MTYKFLGTYISAYGCVYKYQKYLCLKDHLFNLLYVYKVIYIYLVYYRCFMFIAIGILVYKIIYIFNLF